MFVKWKGHELRRLEGGHAISASLVESARPAGEPRHRHICYIGTYFNPDTYMRPDAPLGRPEPSPLGRLMIGDQDYCRARFWRAAVENLARAGIVGPELEGIVAALERRVPRPAQEGQGGLWSQHAELRRQARETAAFLAAYEDDDDDRG